MNCSNCNSPHPAHELAPYNAPGALCLSCLYAKLESVTRERDQLKHSLEQTAKGAFDAIQALARDNAELRKDIQSTPTAKLHALEKENEELKASFSQTAKVAHSAIQHLATENSILLSEKRKCPRCLGTGNTCAHCHLVPDFTCFCGSDASNPCSACNGKG